jgi:hypothetical protein
MKWSSAVFVVTLSCARTVNPGPGVVNAAASQHLTSLADQGRREAMVHALKAADADPSNLRAQRKATELVQDQLETLRQSSEIAALYARAQGLLSRMETGAEACTTRVEAGRVRSAADDREAAAHDFVRSAKDCRSVPAFIQAGFALRSMSQCDQVLALAPVVWPAATKNQWISVFDTVASCSNALTLRGNLAFAPEQTVTDYYTLIQQRQTQRAEAEKEAELQRTKEAIEEHRSRCEAGCTKTAELCASTCSSNQACRRRCRSDAITCVAGCI